METMILLISATLLAQPPSRETLRLPDGIAGESTGFSETAVAPFDKTEFKIQSGWVESKHWIANGDLGWSILDYVLDGPEESWTIDLNHRRATRTARFGRMGYSAADLDKSPIAALRVLDAARAAGARVDERNLDGERVFTIPLPDGRSRLDLRCDNEGAVIRSASIGPADGAHGVRTTYEYRDWIAINGGLHHPSSVRVVLHPPEGQETIKVVKLTALQPLEPGAKKPDLPALPPDITVLDYIDLVTRDSHMRALGPIQPQNRSTDQPTPDEGRGLRVATISAGVLSLVAAGAVWQRRRSRP